MGFITEMDTEDLVTAAFTSLTTVYTDGVPQPKSWTTAKSIDGLMWEGQKGTGVVSDKIKSEVEGVLATDYDSTIAALGDNSKFIVSSVTYKVLHIENVGRQNEVLQIYYKRDTAN